MAASTLDLPGEKRHKDAPGHGTEALGPSDSSDSGSDMQGVGGGAAHRPGAITPTGRALGDGDLDSDTDAQGTGERSTAGHDSEVPDDHDIGVDRVVSADEVGLGGGLDQAEEAWTGRLDDDGDALAADRPAPADAEAVELRSGRGVDDISAQAERTQAADAAIAGGVDDDELMDQLHSGSDGVSTGDTELAADRGAAAVGRGTPRPDGER